MKKLNVKLTIPADLWETIEEQLAPHTVDVSPALRKYKLFYYDHAKVEYNWGKLYSRNDLFEIESSEIEDLTPNTMVLIIDAETHMGRVMNSHNAILGNI